MQNQKTYSKEKLESFLSKIQKKLNDESEKITPPNKEAVNNWINELNKNNSDKIEITYNKQCLEEHQQETEENLINCLKKENPEVIMKELTEMIEKMAHSKITIPQKEEILTAIETNYINPKNLIENKIDILQLETILINLLQKTNEQSLDFDSLNASLVLSSVLIKKLIRVSTLTTTGIELPRIEKFANFFTKQIKLLLIYSDFRLRTCLINTIGDITSYMLFCQMEGNVIEIITLLFNELKLSAEAVYLEINKVMNQNSKDKEGKENEEKDQKPNSKAQHLSLDSNKNILLEIISRLPIDNDIFPQCQQILVDKVAFIYDIISDNKNNLVISLLVMSYEILTYYFKMPFYKKRIENNIEEFKQKYIPRIAAHLITPSPQLRYWIINYLISFNTNFPLKNDEYFIHNILPLICLNRYLPVDGVKNNSMTLWKTVVEMNGISIIKNNYESFLICYLNELSSISESGKEAACRCVQELIMKVYEPTLHKEIVKKHHKDMLQKMIKCARDPCYNVRESGLISIGYVYGNIKEFIDNDKEIIDDICILIKEHCFDNIIEVRDASAFALRIYGSQKGKLNEDYISFYIKLLNSVNNSDEINNLYQEIKKEIFTNITIKQDFGFMREVEINEVKDGVIHLIKELCDDPNNYLYNEFKMTKDNLLMTVIDYLCKNYHNGLSNLNKKTVWEALNVLMLQIDKSEVEFYLDYIIDILLSELENNLNSLSGYQAEKFVSTMVQKGISKRMIKGKVREKIKGKSNLVTLFERLLK